MPLNSHQFSIRHKPNLQGAQLRFFVQVLYKDVKRDVYLAPGASIESVVPSFKVVIRPDSLSIYAPGLRGEDRAFSPRGL